VLELSPSKYKGPLWYSLYLSARFKLHSDAQFETSQKS